MFIWPFSSVVQILMYDIFSLSGIYFAEHSSKSNQYVYGIGGGSGCPVHKDRSCYSCYRSAFPWCWCFESKGYIVDSRPASIASDLTCSALTLSGSCFFVALLWASPSSSSQQWRWPMHLPATILLWGGPVLGVSVTQSTWSTEESRWDYLKPHPHSLPCSGGQFKAIVAHSHFFAHVFFILYANNFSSELIYERWISVYEWILRRKSTKDSEKCIELRTHSWS